jgi:hypothetical protein
MEVFTEHLARRRDMAAARVVEDLAAVRRELDRLERAVADQTPSGAPLNGGALVALIREAEAWDAVVRLHALAVDHARGAVPR